MDTDLIQVLEQMEHLVAFAQARLSRYVAVADAARALVALWPILITSGETLTLSVAGYTLLNALRVLDGKTSG